MGNFREGYAGTIEHIGIKKEDIPDILEHIRADKSPWLGTIYPRMLW